MSNINLPELLLGREKFLLCSFFSPPPKLSAANREVSELPPPPEVRVDDEDELVWLAPPEAPAPEEEEAPVVTAPLSRQSLPLEKIKSGYKKM
jgi:hypothetical protein